MRQVPESTAGRETDRRARLRLLGVREAAELLGVHENTLRRWETAGIITAVRLPTGQRRFRPEEVEKLVASMRTGFSLRTREGAEAVANLAHLANRKTTLEELDDERYGIEPDGTLRLDIDEDTFEFLTARR
jgi:excisionase family DNA binding protein